MEKKLKVYLSLPITGYEENERRCFAARTSAELMYKNENWDVINPFHIYDHLRAELLSSGVFDEPHYDDILAADLAQLDTCDAAYFVSGWGQSNGCQVEMKHCKDNGITIFIE